MKLTLQEQWATDEVTGEVVEAALFHRSHVGPDCASLPHSIALRPTNFGLLS